MKRTATILGVILVVLVAAGAFAMSRKSNSNDKTANPQTTQSAADTTTTTPTTQSDTDQSNVATITYDGSSFSPATLTVKSGTKITIKNTSSKTLQFDSDPHPVHTDNSELNVDFVSAGESATFTVDKTGTWGYHNHLNESQTGTIIVQ